MASDPKKADQRLAREALAAGNPTGWFEPLYVAAETGDAVVPWDRGAPNAGRRSLVRRPTPTQM